MADDAEVVITRRLNARPDQVFEACSNPKLLARWFGPKGFDVCEVDVDLRVGGHFAFRMKNDQGMYGARGVYQEVTPPTRLVLTWLWTESGEGDELDGVESLVTFDVRPDRDATLLTLTHSRLRDQASADSHGEGWTETLDKLEQLLDNPGGAR